MILQLLHVLVAYWLAAAIPHLTAIFSAFNHHSPHQAKDGSKLRSSEWLGGLHHDEVKPQ